MSRLTQDGTAEPVSRDQILRRECGQGNIDVPRSADHEQDWQPVDLYSCYVWLTRDGTAEPVSRDQTLRRLLYVDREICIFPVQLTTNRIGSRLIHTLTICVTIHFDWID